MPSDLGMGPTVHSDSTSEALAHSRSTLDSQAPAPRYCRASLSTGPVRISTSAAAPPPQGKSRATLVFGRRMYVVAAWPQDEPPVPSSAQFPVLAL